jgi:hypothetical protein
MSVDDLTRHHRLLSDLLVESKLSLNWILFPCFASRVTRRFVAKSPNVLPKPPKIPTTIGMWTKPDEFKTNCRRLKIAQIGKMCPIWSPCLYQAVRNSSYVIYLLFISDAGRRYLPIIFLINFSTRFSSRKKVFGTRILLRRVLVWSKG